jgi:hypothetical protein
VYSGDARERADADHDRGVKNEEKALQARREA